VPVGVAAVLILVLSWFYVSWDYVFGF